MNEPNATSLHLNNTGRIVINQEAAERLERLGQPKYLTLTIIGDDFRLVPADKESEDTLKITYREWRARYTSCATRYFKPLGFKQGKGNPSYPLDATWDGGGFKFPSPFSKK